jgi:hypothetical protein
MGEEFLEEFGQYGEKTYRAIRGRKMGGFTWFGN